MLRGILCDLDGVVYRGRDACPGAVEGLTGAREAGVRILFMTNNAGRSPEDVAEHLTELGLPTPPGDVLTASQVAAATLVDLLEGVPKDQDGAGDPGEPGIMAVGGPGVGAALTEVGLSWCGPAEVRRRAETGPVAPRIHTVVQGYGADVGWADLTEVAYAVRAGATWVATNDDATLPTARGLAVGNGSLVAAVAHATQSRPLVTGKPHAPAYRVALDRLGFSAQECLMLGDRLDTDIAGARAAGIPSALVLTGVSTAAEARAAGASERPDHLEATIPDLAHLWGGAR